MIAAICVGLFVAGAVAALIGNLPERIELCATCLKRCSGVYCSRACRAADDAELERRAA
jgi:hypothetical protein